MSALTASRTAQYPLVAEFTFSIGDTMTNTSGAADAFATVAAHVFDVINLPPYAIVTGGEVVTETAFTGSTAYNVTVGDSASAARYLGTTDKTAAARTALVPTGFVGAGEVHNSPLPSLVEIGQHVIPRHNPRDFCHVTPDTNIVPYNEHSTYLAHID